MCQGDASLILMPTGKEQGLEVNKKFIVGVH
jgi:hypothetical protein